MGTGLEGGGVLHSEIEGVCHLPSDREPRVRSIERDGGRKRKRKREERRRERWYNTAGAAPMFFPLCITTLTYTITYSGTLAS